ncbi:hypothetical protein [Limnoglobus roseus]|uniref:Uncharacterized protein n=1 Tax=Limnoglobus roseus TaxID=2598579 RepID=A0A5C1A9K1_9BACT|nr:hypothetical protein [Limnoglobus roseus]QEL16049.1 hypothetical protein PX52LOC_02988 [Limnoglobus roseus]
MNRLILILFAVLIVGTAGCANPFRRATDVPSCYFPKPSKATDPLLREELAQK